MPPTCCRSLSRSLVRQVRSPAVVVVGDVVGLSPYTPPEFRDEAARLQRDWIARLPS